VTETNLKAKVIEIQFGKRAAFVPSSIDDNRRSLKDRRITQQGASACHSKMVVREMECQERTGV